METKTLVQETTENGHLKNDSSDKGLKQPQYELRIKWFNVSVYLYFHLAALYGLYTIFTLQCRLYTVLFQLSLWPLAGLGITAGVHRLWSHKAFKATLPLRLFLAFCQTVAFQNDIYQWARDHRVHHKHTDTDADPHNSLRGFFFAHVGWLMVHKHPEVEEKGRSIDLSDLEADPVVRWQRKLYVFLVPLLCFFLPTWFPVYCWGENPWISWHLSVFRFILILHFTWSVNSVAHMFGSKPYDGKITPTENIPVTIFALGEGWHNYHHTFPWDYRSSELGDTRYNFTTGFIHLCAWLGLASELRAPSDELVKQKILASGDGSHRYHQTQVWGWEDQVETDTEMAIRKSN